MVYTAQNQALSRPIMTLWSSHGLNLKWYLWAWIGWVGLWIVIASYFKPFLDSPALLRTASEE